MIFQPSHRFFDVSGWLKKSIAFKFEGQCAGDGIEKEVVVVRSEVHKHAVDCRKIGGLT